MNTNHKEKNITNQYSIKLTCVFLFILLVTLFVYWNLSTYDFTNFDDYFYVTKNEHINTGISFENIIWAFKLSTENRTYWHPLTWLSHMLDCQIFGLSPGPHHMMNLFIHIVNSLLLFLIFNKTTGALWKSAIVATLFAIHPINVESVAWVAERKNVLSSLFWLLTIISYIYYSKRPGVARYLLMLLVFSAGLLAKPMLVTLPFALLLLDFWPMDRIRYSSSQDSESTTNAINIAKKASPMRLFIEKTPLIFLALMVTGIVFISLTRTQAIISTQTTAVGPRFFNALISYTNYLYKLIWPFNLAAYYPFPESFPVWQIISSLIILALVTAFVLYKIKKSPYLFTGWFWFLGTLFPVIGFIQGGLWPAMADRWAYIPAIGFFTIVVWGGDELLSRFHNKSPLKILISLTIIIFLSFTARSQLMYWENSITLFEHALNITDNNPTIHFNLGSALAEENLTDQAILHYNEALRLKPDYAKVHTNLGNALHRKGLMDQAIPHYHSAAILNPDDAKSQIDLANAYSKCGQLDEAISLYTDALRIQPDNPQTHFNMGVVLYKNYQYNEAFIHFQTAIYLKPDYNNARKVLNILKAAGYGRQ